LERAVILDGCAILLAVALCDPSPVPPLSSEWSPGFTVVNWQVTRGAPFEAGQRPDYTQVESASPQPRDNARWALHADDESLYTLQPADPWGLAVLQLYVRSVSWPTASGMALPSAPSTGPWDRPWLLQDHNRIGDRLRWYGDHARAGLLLLRQHYRDGDQTVGGGDFGMPLAGGSIRLRGLVLGSMASTGPAAEGSLSRPPAHAGSQIRLALDNDGPDFAGSFAFEQTSGNFRNDLGQESASGIRRVEAAGGPVWHALGPIERLHVYLLGITTGAVEGGTRVQRALRLGAAADVGSLRLTSEWRGAESLRTSPEAALQSEHYLHLDMAGEFASWAPWVHVAVDAGRLVDVASGTSSSAWRQVAEGSVGFRGRTTLYLSFQYQSDLGGRYREQDIRLDLVRSIAAGLDVRLLHTRSARMRSDAWAVDDGERTLALALRIAVRGTEIYGGLSRAQNRNTNAANELFIRFVQPL
jgi:hypothetical protein